MATLLANTNKVLKRLREETVTDLTDDYANLVASFIADIAQEVNEAFEWMALNHTETISVVANTQTYAIPNTNSKSMLLYDQTDCPVVTVFVSATGGVPLPQIDIDILNGWMDYNTTITAALPQYFAIQPNSTNTGLEIVFYPIPSATATVTVTCHTPEAELDPSTDAAVNIKVDNRVVRLGALYYALNERGEEMGEPGGIAEQRYLKALGAAIETEIRNRERLGYYDWSRI